MQFVATATRPARLRADCLVVGIHEGKLGDEARQIDRATAGLLSRLLRAGDFTGRTGETLLLPEVRRLGSPRLLLVGLGPIAGYDRRRWRKAVGEGLRALLRTRARSAALALERPPSRELDDRLAARSVADLAAAALYRINDLKTARRPKPAALARLLLPVAADGVAAARRGFAEGTALGESSALLRNLANLPANICTPRYLAAQATQVGRGRGRLRVRALGLPQIRRLGMGCFLAVAQGSAEPPRFIIMEYRGGRRGAAPLVLVGKGVTFDTGGISLKDQNAMDEMKYDMCGAATVIAALDFAARMQLRLNLVGLVAATENMPGGRAVKPGDIATSADGQTVEILNTDAEGRLILSDALHYARRYKPDAVVDLATLTGACVIALGHHHTGVMGNDEDLQESLVAAGRRADDRAWRLPLTEEYGEQLKSNFADLANIGGRDGGAITAAAFLGKFTKGLHWAHMDIAGTAWVSGDKKSATARPLPLLADFLIERASR